MSKIDETTRIAAESQAMAEEDKDEEKKEREPLPSLSDIDSTDDEMEGYYNFNIKLAQNDLMELPGCRRVNITSQMQKILGVEVGINVSQEFPWKRVRFERLTHGFFDTIENGEEIQDHFVRYKNDDRILFGYNPGVSQEEVKLNMDPFIMFVSEQDARKAAAIIKNIEVYERYAMNKRLTKRPGPWVSKGSEPEVDMLIPLKKKDSVDIEIQSVYPMKQSTRKFKFRLAADVRDGYVELIAGDEKFQNVVKQKIHVGVQVAPATVTLEQQTNPTFPSNSWAQYLYEIKEEEGDGLDVTTDEEAEKPKTGPPSKATTPVEEKPPKEPPEMSDQVKHLLTVLEFNQVDMYRDDYSKIADIPVQIYSNPYLEEIFCFANISKSNLRYVSAVDWYPFLTGIVVSAYAFTTKVSLNSSLVKDKTDFVQRTILQPNPILMWSFMDSLNFKLQFEAMREVTALSFCPYDDNILIGGTINGQIIIWDLQDRAKNLEAEEHLTISEAANRELIAEFLAWTITYDEGTWVIPAAVSILEHSQTEAITEIKWLSRNNYISTKGRVHETFSNKKSRYFATLSIDGTIAFWTLDYDIGKAAKAAAKKNLPAALTQSESQYKKMDRLIRPSFMVHFNEPLTTFICETANYTYIPQIMGSVVDREIKTYPILVQEAEQRPFKNSLIVGSYFGRIENIVFEGTDSDDIVNKENISSPAVSFARVHDGPIVSMVRNPFYKELFLSVGRTVLAIWREDYPFTPIMWRVRPKALTAAKWSTDRPAVLFITCADGSFEAWDLLARDDDACLIEVIGGGIITVLSEHRAAVPKKVISIGDYNSSFRMVALPEGFYHALPNEEELLKTYIENEVYRKKSIQTWKQEWCVKNADIIEARKRMEAEAAADLERLRLEEEERKAKLAAEAPKPPPEPTKGARYILPEILDKKFDELNLKRLMHNLMSRKMVNQEKLDRETALEKKRINYEERKKESIRQALAKVSEEIAAIRARLLPVKKEDVKLSDMVEATVKQILDMSTTYANVEKDLNEFLDEAPPIPTMTIDEILHRCKQRRSLLNKVLGVPSTRKKFCKEQGAENFADWNLGFKDYLKTQEDYKEESINESAKDYSGMDLVPTKDMSSDVGSRGLRGYGDQ